MGTYAEPARVDLVDCSQGLGELKDMMPDDIIAYGALGCFEEKAVRPLYLEDIRTLSKPEIMLKEKAVIDKSAGLGHGSVLDQAFFGFCIEDLTRAATLMLCGPEYMAHEQQSLRRAKADRGFYLSPVLREKQHFSKINKVLSGAFELYERMNTDDKPKDKKTGIPGEDARYIIPLLTKTNIKTESNARELMHFFNLTNKLPKPISTVYIQMEQEVKKLAPITFEYRPGSYQELAWFPSPFLFARKNITLDEIISNADNPTNATFITHEITDEMIDRALVQKQEGELANLKHSHNGSHLEGYLAPMSLAAFHQMTRQRTLNQSVESIYSAYKRRQIVVPPKIAKSDFKDEYIEYNKTMFEAVDELIAEKVPISEAIGALPHSLVVNDLMHVNGVNSYLFIGKRTCDKAQWEIRGIAIDIAKNIREKNPIFDRLARPQGITYGKCPESDPCLKVCPEFPGTDPEIFYPIVKPEPITI